MNEVNVLITAASRRVALVKSFMTALQNAGGQVITVDYDMHSPALFFSHKYYQVPLVDDLQYLPKICEIIEKENINLIIPTIDPELMLWAKNKDNFEKRGICISVSPPETIKTCLDKWETFRFFKAHQLPFPESYLPGMTTGDMTYPLFIKPRIGRGSVHAYQIRNKKELDFFLEYVPNPLVQDYLAGKEFTVDAFYSREHRLISLVSRYRLVIRSGVSDRGKTFMIPEMTELITKIGQKLQFSGAINIQGKIVADNIIFFEINPRFSGGIQLSIAAGENFADYIIREHKGETLIPRLNEFNDHLIMASYEDSLFLDGR
ncbi:MAG TPA: ATP-grasp domain-containing protein [Candidatus Deferrimicrobium sp.]|nr:ATP-grasp domain-containing protein [Candidatus Deferrimicrobium sp.]